MADPIQPDPETDPDAGGTAPAAPDEVLPPAGAPPERDDFIPGRVFAAMGDDTEPNYLGDPNVTRALAGNLIDDSLRARGDVLEGTLTEAKLLAQTQAGIQRLTRILMGQDKSYVPMSDWNGRGLAAWLRSQLGVVGDDDAQTIEAALNSYIASVWQAGQAYERDEMDLEELRIAAGQHADELGRLLVGIPADLEDHGLE